MTYFVRHLNKEFSQTDLRRIHTVNATTRRDDESNIVGGTLPW